MPFQWPFPLLSLVQRSNGLLAPSVPRLHFPSEHDTIQSWVSPACQVNLSTSSILKVIPSHSSLCNSCGLLAREALTGPCGSKARIEQSSNAEQAFKKEGELKISGSFVTLWPIRAAANGIVPACRSHQQQYRDRHPTIGLQLISLSCPTAVVHLSSHSMYACFASMF